MTNKPKTTEELRAIFDGFFKAFPEAKVMLAKSMQEDSEYRAEEQEATNDPN